MEGQGEEAGREEDLGEERGVRRGAGAARDTLRGAAWELLAGPHFSQDCRLTAPALTFEILISPSHCQLCTSYFTLYTLHFTELIKLNIKIDCYLYLIFKPALVM